MKRMKICASGVSIQYMQGNFDTKSVQGHSEVIRWISDFPQLCISKKAGRRRKRMKICVLRISIQYIQGTFDS